MESSNLMEQIQPALTPLTPMFDIIDTVIVVFKSIEAHHAQPMSVPDRSDVYIVGKPEVLDWFDSTKAWARFG